jgi:HD-GYP domain-containing protein (c-di-GMP phosphodiesterase class II)
VTRLSDLVRGQSSDQCESGRSAGDAQVAFREAGLRTAHTWYAAARQEVGRAVEMIRAKAVPRLEPMDKLARDLVEALRQTDELIRLAIKGRSDDYLVDNAVHVAIIGVKIGMGLGYPEEDLQRLALAGLLHDVGMWTLPATVLAKPGALSTEEKDLVRAHPERGRRILTGLGRDYEWCAVVAAQEHERWDGSGYPCRLKGRQISEHAHIIGLADTFDALITTRPYRKPIAPHQAVRELLVEGKRSFAHGILKSLGDHVTLYPIGTTVRLNTGEVGVVERVNPRSPLRPVLALKSNGVSGSEGRTAIDLRESLSAHIVEVLPPIGASKEEQVWAA